MVALDGPPNVPDEYLGSWRFIEERTIKPIQELLSRWFFLVNLDESLIIQILQERPPPLFPHTDPKPKSLEQQESNGYI
ncbi:hypothetical protein AMEX_G27770 [Astyanax mexicanus]|uniref:Uncharacterized protein n=1 Tax=Astyanax mexicanus TaxID=7994 RepID=A0A8T2KJZ3_ASTMX|nr:hypothetical protein AMEX_G27770 [Astyanax mexicanus]